MPIWINRSVTMLLGTKNTTTVSNEKIGNLSTFSRQRSHSPADHRYDSEISRRSNASTRVRQRIGSSSVLEDRVPPTSDSRSTKMTQQIYLPRVMQPRERSSEYLQQVNFPDSNISLLLISRIISEMIMVSSPKKLSRHSYSYS